ncbi:MAG TPA: transporter substrate-binding domain-containing protein [Luteibacter sp.]|jgi:two-component system sensor histidine kinase EvgS|uniref:ATP-binding protein n=1 Tax=Luteibacter sp. TaxID=1886636 RepID=UPI002F424A10
MQPKPLLAVLLWLGLGLAIPARGAPPAEPQAATHVSLSAEEREYLASLPALKVAVDRSFVPYTMVDNQGVPAGLAADYVQLVASRLSLKLDYVVTDSWQATLEASRRGDVDLLPAIVSDGEAAALFKASEPYITFPMMVVVREGSPPLTSLSDLHGKRILANPRRAADVTALRSIDEPVVLPITSPAEGMKRLASGEGDALFANLATADYYLGRQYRATLRLAAPANIDEALSIGVRPRLAPLLPLINRALRSVSVAERARIRNNWVAAHYTFRPSAQQLMRDVLPYGVLALAIVLSLAYAYWRLRREVRMRRMVERQLDDVAANLPAVVYKLVIHPDGRRRFLYVGGNPRPVIGMEASEILGDETPVLHTIHPDDRAALLAALKHSAETLTPLRMVLRAQVDDQLRYVSSEARPRRDADGATYWSGFWSDVTHEHEQAEALAQAVESAQQANEAKSRFLAMMSHEIRTPMNGIIGHLELLSADAMAPEQARLAGMVNESAQSLMRILNDILDFSKVEVGEMHVEMGPVDMRQLLDAGMAAFAPAAQAKGVSISSHVDDDVPPCVRGDAGRIGQVLGNLLSNAVKFTEHGSVFASITVSHEGETPRLVLTVRDTGVGIDASRQEAIWQPFVQSDTTITRRFGGTGLGLAICRQLMTLMQGSISLQSVPGQGTTVQAWWPLEPMDATVLMPSPVNESVRSAPAVAAAALGRALVVDDHPTNRSVLSAQLGRLGFEAIEAGDGRAALAMLAAMPFRVVLTDLHMPGLDGIALVRAIHESTSEAPPVIGVTADVRPDVVAECIRTGMRTVLAKPCVIADVREALSQLGLLDEADASARPFVVDLPRLRGTFGDDAAVAAVLASCIATTHEALAKLTDLQAHGSPTALGEWLHFVLGGLSIVFTAEAIAPLRQIERDLMQSHESRVTFPSCVEIYVRTMLARMEEIFGPN